MKRVLQALSFGIFVSLIGCEYQEIPKSIAHSSAAVDMVCGALAIHYVNWKILPKDQEEMHRIITDPVDGYYRAEGLIDGWKHPLHYTRTGELTATLWSEGRDVTDKNDDIRCSLTFDLQRQTVREAFKKPDSPHESITERHFSDYVQTR